MTSRVHRAKRRPSVPPATASSRLSTSICRTSRETARAKRLPHRELTDTRRAAREQQVRNVRARHQQENRRRAQQQRQHVTQAASQVRAKRNDLCRDPGVGLRILAGELCRHNIELPLEFDRPRRQVKAGR